MLVRMVTIPRVSVERGVDILVLEDDHSRVAVFQKNLIGTNTVFVETVEDAIANLESNAWDYLFLDHDLGGEQMVESGEGTGYAVAEWLVENPDRKPVNIVIHSYNPVGAQNIKKALPEAVVAPGCWSSLRIRGE